ncbi:MAG: DUF1214 domain-containing protein [Sphingopyxis sp.]|nr:DUF1214 domain-containing protein [Sphingopyxis sp.]
MKSWQRYSIAIISGLVFGLGGAWALTNRGLSGGQIVNGPWQTSLGYGVKATDPITRAAVARSGLLALPATETLYWQAARDSEGRALTGKCRYRLTGSALDARWWSVTVYDTTGYLMPNEARVWSVNGATVPLDAQQRWQVRLSSGRPPSGGWLPTTGGRGFHLTLRMYNPGKAFMADPSRAMLPQIVREACI